jgi:hypothetical protein
MVPTIEMEIGVNQPDEVSEKMKDFWPKTFGLSATNWKADDQTWLAWTIKNEEFRLKIEGEGNGQEEKRQENVSQGLRARITKVGN